MRNQTGGALMEARTLACMIQEQCRKQMAGIPADVVITLYDESTGLKMVGWDIQYVLPGDGLNTGDPTLEIVCRAARIHQGEPR